MKILFIVMYAIYKKLNDPHTMFHLMWLGLTMLLISHIKIKSEIKIKLISNQVLYIGK